MSRKRVKTDTLTGGTGDVNPQYITFGGQQTAADTNTIYTLPVPIQGITNPAVGSNSSIVPVMEVLKIIARLGGVNITAGSNTTEDVSFWTANPGTGALSNNGPLGYSQCFADVGYLSEATGIVKEAG